MWDYLENVIVTLDLQINSKVLKLGLLHLLLEIKQA